MSPLRTADLVIGVYAEFIDSDDFRDKHERAMRDHILGGPDDHVCDDLCSSSIIDRLLLGRSRGNEYPRRNEYPVGSYLADLEKSVTGDPEGQADQFVANMDRPGWLCEGSRCGCVVAGGLGGGTGGHKPRCPVGAELDRQRLAVNTARSDPETEYRRPARKPRSCVKYGRGGRI